MDRNEPSHSASGARRRRCRSDRDDCLHASCLASIRRVAIEHAGYLAVDVMARLFGNDQHEQSRTVELRALDGYVSRIDVARLLHETAN